MSLQIKDLVYWTSKAVPVRSVNSAFYYSKVSLPMEVELCAGEEYRIETFEDKKVRIMVVAGIGEVNGQELLCEEWHDFSNVSLSIFTFTGLKMVVDGVSSLRYTATSSMFPEAMKLFLSLPSLPTVLIVGNGRSTLSSTLLNYFARSHRKSIFTELDPGSSNIFPGALSSLLNASIVDYREGIRLQNPICIFYGDTKVSNKDLYDIQIKKLKKLIDQRYSREDDPGLDISYSSETAPLPGIAEDEKGDEAKTRYPHLILGPSFKGMSDAAINAWVGDVTKTYCVTDVVVVGNERLYHIIDTTFNKVFIQNPGYTFTSKINKSISRYFSGIDGEYTSSSVVIKPGTDIVRIGEEYVAPDSALPLGATRKIDKLKITNTELVDYAILAISEAEDEESIVTSPVLGFLVCTDAKKRKVVCTQSKLPKKRYIIQGIFKHLDY